MNWKSVLPLSLFGILMGVLNVFGVTSGLEWILWLVIALISALVIEKTSERLLVTQGFLVGFLDSLFNGLVTAIFWEKYLLNNPNVLERLSEMPENLAPEFFIIIASVLIGMVYGLFIGLVVFLTRKAKRRSKPENN
ncbi:MAG: hypothetical protein KDC73_09530 [Ignavibacteriae bacterium]|nr:hypothetical protein [Ignavibacteriota bacterium]MCB9242049.1 hypothetical protein [Ignavibacteriales bacterium]